MVETSYLCFCVDEQLSEQSDKQRKKTQIRLDGRKCGDPFTTQHLTQKERAQSVL